MTFEIGLVLTILTVAIVVFLAERWRADLVSLMVLVTLALTGLVTPTEAFAGFANPAVVTVGAIFVVSAGLLRSGVADFLGARMLKIAGTSEPRLIVVIMLTAGVISAFINNIGATAVLMPVVISMARETRISVSKLLMPLAFASAMGGNLTLIGTPPNVLASAILHERTGNSYMFFDFTPMGILILASGIAYMVFIGRHLLPTRRSETELTENYHVREYLCELLVLPSSPLIGRSIIESRLGEDYELTVINIIRDKKPRPFLRRVDKIRANDILVVAGSRDKILQIGSNQGIIRVPDIDFHDTDFKSDHADIAEVVLDVQSSLAGSSLKDLRFRERYRLTVLALWRRGQNIESPLKDVPLRPGDVLLVQGRREAVDFLRVTSDFLVLEPFPLQHRRTSHAPRALAILGGMLLLVTTSMFHISIASVLAAVCMILFGVLKIDEAYQAIDWQSMFVIAGMLPLGIAMENTGAAQFLANLVVTHTVTLGPIGLIVGIYLFTSLMTQPLSNAAAMVLLAPIALNIAADLGANPEAFLMVVVVGASTSFLTPIAHQSNIVIFGPGGYRFTDYTRVGLGLNLMYAVLVAVMLPLIWPLY